MQQGERKINAVAVFAGPSGGHLYPAWSFAEKLKIREPQARVYLVTSEKAKRFMGDWTPFPFEKVFFLNAFPSAAGISLRAPAFLLQLLRAFVRSFFLLEKTKPLFCAGFGSYVSFPGMMLSVWRGIPALIHEQNAVPGKANQWLARHVDCVAVSFPQTAFNSRVKRLEKTGLPLRSYLTADAKDAKDGESPGRSGAQENFKLLVLGGSQGAAFLNRVVPEAFSFWSPAEKGKIAVTHITGESDFRRVSKAYAAEGVRARVLPFFDRMDSLYRWADTAVTRAGANTLFELALFQLPAVVIPYPHAAGHQRSNARYFAERGAVICEEQPALTARKLGGILRDLYQAPSRRNAMAAALKTLSSKDAADKLAALALTYL